MAVPIATIKQKSQRKRSLIFDILGIGVPLSILVLFIFIPFFLVLFLAIGETSKGFINAIKTILEGSLYHKIFRFTLLQAGISTGLSLLIGIPVGYIFGRFEFVGRKTLLALVTVPFILPPLYVVLGFIRFWGSKGFFNRFLAIFGVDLGLDLSRGFWAIIMAHAFYNAPLVIYWVSSALAILDKDQIDAARTLGSKNLHFFRRILLPNMIPGLLAASVLTFTYCLLSFAIVLELGGGQLYTIELQIWILYKPPFSLRQLASVLAIFQAFMSILLIYLYSKASAVVLSPVKVGEIKPAERRRVAAESFKKKGLLLGVLGFILIFDLGPMVSIALSAFQDIERRAWTFENFSVLLSNRSSAILHISPAKTIINTFLFASLAVILDLGLVTMAIRGLERVPQKLQHLLESIFFSPIGLSSITIALGLLYTYSRFKWYYTSSWILIVIAHTMIGFPFMFRVLLSSYRKVNPDYVHAARTLGSSQLDAFLRIQLPLMTPGIRTGIAFVIAVSIGEFAATNFIYWPEATTMSIAIYKYIGARQYGIASAMCFLVGLVSMLCFLAIQKSMEEGLPF